MTKIGGHFKLEGLIWTPYVCEIKANTNIKFKTHTKGLSNKKAIIVQNQII